MTTTAQTIPYLMYYHDIDKPGMIGRLCEIDRDATSDDYGRIQQEFEAEATNGSPGKYSYVSMFRWDDFEQFGDIHYNSELAGMDGASFFVFSLPDSDQGAIDRCCDYIRRSFDVVRLKVIKITQMI
jgi:hypothetical protein